MRYFGYRNGKYGLIKKSVYMSRKKLRKPRKKPASRRKAVSRKTARRRSAKRISVFGQSLSYQQLVKKHGVKKASTLWRNYGGMTANPAMPIAFEDRAPIVNSKPPEKLGVQRCDLLKNQILNFFKYEALL